MWKFVSIDCRKMHFASTRTAKNVLKNSSTAKHIFDKSHDVVLKLHKNRKLSSRDLLVVPA